MSKDKEEKDLYERVMKSLRNNWFIVFCMIVSLLYFSISKIVEVTAENIEHISKISGNSKDENTDSEPSSEEPPKETTSTRTNDRKLEPKPSETKTASVEIINFHLMETDMFLVDGVSGRKLKIESSEIKFPIPTNQSTVKFKIKNINGKSFGSTTSDCCNNNLNITYHE